MKWWFIGPVAVFKAVMGACRFMEQMQAVTQDHERRLQAIEERQRGRLQ